MSLKRHPALQPFSRDHVVGLFHAHQLMWLSEGKARFDAVTTISRFREAWKTEIEKHFDDEEKLLTVLPVKPESIGRLLQDHSDLRLMVGSLSKTSLDFGLCRQVGSRLEEHIRWEEHEFFPEIEKSLSTAALETLQKLTEEIDKSRRRSV